MKFLIINGPNLNLLGRPGAGISTAPALCRPCAAGCRTMPPPTAGVGLLPEQSRGSYHRRHSAGGGVYDGIVINPAAYTHYSYAIYDALRAVDVPAVEVHLSDIRQRESFRQISVTAPACRGQIMGHGFDGYLEALVLAGGGPSDAAVCHRGSGGSQPVAPHPPAIYGEVRCCWKL
ncbi:MAG: type II 3-dehydroquinate dehydratase [Dysosmobacter sp.]